MHQALNWLLEQIQKRSLSIPVHEHTLVLHTTNDKIILERVDIGASFENINMVFISLHMSSEEGVKGGVSQLVGNPQLFPGYIILSLIPWFSGM